MVVGEQAGNVGKVAVLEAGWSDSVSVATVNHYCASSLWAFNTAAARVLAGEGLMVAGGVESMSRVPMASDRPPFLSDPATVQRLRTPPMGVSADAIATLYGILREEAEAYRSRVVAQAEGDSQRFRSVLTEYQKAPAVTRDRLYIDTMQQVYSNVTKVMIDSRSGSNLLYLPLDKLIQQAAAPAAPAATAGIATPGASTDSSAPTAIDVRSRDGTRSRDREGR